VNTDRSVQRRRQAAEQAAEWLIGLQSDRLSFRERGEYIEWLRESPVHVAEMLRISQIHQALAECSKWSRNTQAAEGEIDNLISPSAFARVPARRKLSRVSLVGWLSAAGLAGLAIMGVWLSRSRGELIIRTEERDRREVTLADGSTVDVAPSSEVRVRMLDAQRLVELTHGQAFFHVAKNAKRPFIVDAGHASVRAVGTAFDVTRSAAEVTVTVIEGRVAVVREQPGSKNADQPIGAVLEDVFLNANEQVSLAASTRDVAVHKVDGATEAAWTRGNFIFDDEPLEAVVRRFNTYNSAQIRLLDSALATRRVSGVFRASDPESLIAFVRSMAGDAQGDEPIRLDPP
jgi:transmembrane sensor